MRFLVGKLMQGGGVLLTVSFLTFALLAAVPGNFLSEARLDPRISAGTLRELNARYGLDRPLLSRYGEWLRAAVHGDLGLSFAYATPVSTLLVPRIRNTLILTISGAIVSWAIAILLGVWAAANEKGGVDRFVGAVTSALVAMPDVLWVTALLLFAVRTRLLPAGGMSSIDFADRTSLGKMRDLLSHGFLPLTAIVLSTLPSLVRHVRASVASVLRSDYITAGRARGVPRWRILYHHALRPAANPLISLAGLSFGGLLGTSLVVEVVLSWPGIGPLLVEAVLSRDILLVMAAVNVSTALAVAGTFLADVALRMSDPRIGSS
jgi:peptide/nickel transport system permease protein